MSDFVKELNATDFDAETAAGLVVVDFWAPWCQPCKMMAPIFGAVAEKLAGKATFAKVNIDESPEIAAKFGVRSIPTLLVMKDGKEADMHVGLMRPDDLITLVNSNI